MDDASEPTSIGAIRGTGARIASLLRQGPRTIDELADALAVTPNAVRSHVLRLEEAGIVRRTGLRAAVTRPAVEYALSAEGEALFSRAYAPLLSGLLEVLGKRLDPGEYRAVFRELGVSLRQAPSDAARVASTPAERAAAASAHLDALGAVTTVERAADGWRVRGVSCPVAAATRTNADACVAIAAVLEGAVDAPVTACCERGERPRCCFSIELPAE